MFSQKGFETEGERSCGKRNINLEYVSKVWRTEPVTEEKRIKESLWFIR